jgi:hypothetical protein
MSFQSSEVGWPFWLKWVVASTIAVIAGGMAGIPIGFGLGDALFPRHEVLSLAVVGACVGLFLAGALGVGQWVVLQAYLPDLRRWVPYSAAAAAFSWGLVFPLLINTFEGNDEMWPPVSIILATVMGAAVGIAQWLVLRDRVPAAGLWIPVCTVGLGIALVTGLFLGGEGRELISLSAVGSLGGALTGAGMVVLLRRPVTAVAPGRPAG